MFFFLLSPRPLVRLMRLYIITKAVTQIFVTAFWLEIKKKECSKEKYQQKAQQADQTQDKEE